MRWVIVLVLGTGLGLLAALGDVSSGVLHQTLLAEVVTVATHLGTTYAAAGVIAGALLAKRRGAILAGPIVLIAAVVGYTGYVDYFVDHQRLSVDSLSAVFSLYMLAAVAIGPFLSLVGQMTREHSIVGTLARFAVPVALIAEVLVRYPFDRDLYTMEPVRAWTLTATIGIGVLGALAAGLGHQSAQRR